MKETKVAINNSSFENRKKFLNVRKERIWYRLKARVLVGHKQLKR